MRFIDFIKAYHIAMRQKVGIIEHIADLNGTIEDQEWLIEYLQTICATHGICPDCGKKPCELEEDND
jgi:hypothetical protein